MKNLTLVFVFLVQPLFGQLPTGAELLEKTIQYHDPNGIWSAFNGGFEISLTTPKGNPRLSTVRINNATSEFSLDEQRNGNLTERSIKGEDCLVRFNGSADFPDSLKTKYRLTCKRTTMMRNYYTYLYGLPMKLKDPGTIIDSVVTLKKFQGKEYLVLRVTYDAKVGGDSWYFYINPKNYAMENYQFYHDEAKNDGEYITLAEEVNIQGMKIPKVRKWYYNKDDGFLGTDDLTKVLD